MVLYVASDSPDAYQEIRDLAKNPVMSLSRSGDPELRLLSSPREYVQKEFNQLDDYARVLATQGAIVDFALISGFWMEHEDAMPAAVVCTIRYDSLWIYACI